MKIKDIITKYHPFLKALCTNDYRVISQGRTSQDILQDVCITAIRKFKDDVDVDEDDGYAYLKKTLQAELHYQYQRIDNKIIYTDVLPDVPDENVQ